MELLTSEYAGVLRGTVVQVLEEIRERQVHNAFEHVVDETFALNAECTCAQLQALNDIADLLVLLRFLPIICQVLLQLVVQLLTPRNELINA